MADGLVDNFKLMFERLGIMKEEEEEIGEGYIGMIGEEEDCTQAQSNVVKLKSLKKGNFALCFDYFLEYRWFNL